MNDDELDEFLDEINSPALDANNSDLDTNLLDASDGEVYCDGNGSEFEV